MDILTLPQTAQTLYAELREQAVVVAVGGEAGSVVKKTLGKRDYLYFQVHGLDGRTRQHYLGPEHDVITEGLVARVLTRGDAHSEQRRLQQLRAAFLAAGGSAMPTGAFRVIEAFADAGVLTDGGAVLVGTYAFQCLGNLLGVRWQTALHTQDVDVAADGHIELAVRPDAPAPDVLERLNMGFLPVPPLNRKSPSTSYMVRGQELRVDLLTPMTGTATAPRYVAAFAAPAAPVRHLDYLIEEPVKALALGARSLAVVNVPDAARFAWHKLMVSTMRPAVFATKAEKDRSQALQLMKALLDKAPDDLARAYDALAARGAGWSKKVDRALTALRRTAPDVVSEVLSASFASAKERDSLMM